MDRHFLHFNARETREAAQAWIDHLDKGGRMMVTLGGAMSTAELEDLFLWQIQIGVHIFIGG